MIDNRKIWLQESLKETEAIVFDFDNTIVDEQFSVKKRWKLVLKKYEGILDCNNLGETFFDIFNKTESGYKFHLDDTLKKLNLDKKYKATILKDFLEQESLGEYVFPYAVEILNILKYKKIKIALFTNGLKEVQQKRVQLSGTIKYFDYIQYGDCFGKKPSLKGFSKLSESLRLNKGDNFIMIGDSFEDDYQGSTSFGATCILVNCYHNKQLDVPVYRTIEELYFDLNEVLISEN